MSRQGLTAAMVRYLAVLRHIDPRARGVRSIEVANVLKVSRSSVHTMMERLMEQGYIVKEHYGIVYLTEKGMKAAESITPWEAASIPLESD